MPVPPQKLGYRILSATDLAAVDSERREFANEVLVGLSERPKHLSSRFFYDDRGSELFREIMALPEYYLTNCERDIFVAEGGRLAERFADHTLEVVDLGAGDGAKTFILLDALRARTASLSYRPIDISEGAMKTVVAAVREQVPAIDVAGIVSEYADGLEYLAAKSGDAQRLVLFLGSNIGNFDRPRARAFLRRLWNSLHDGDYVLIGFDLKKDIDILLDAYNDSGGVTAAFNLNLLTRINRELGGHFDTGSFRHFGTYDVFSGAMKSYLVSMAEQDIRIDALRTSFHFRAWEPVHTEYSYKYLRSDVISLAAATGFEIELELTDEDDFFVSSLWRVVKGS